jgi:hypothetical protein
MRRLAYFGLSGSRSVSLLISIGCRRRLDITKRRRSSLGPYLLVYIRKVFQMEPMVIRRDADPYQVLDGLMSPSP